MQNKNKKIKISVDGFLAHAYEHFNLEVYPDTVADIPIDIIRQMLVYLEVETEGDL